MDMRRYGRNAGKWASSVYGWAIGNLVWSGVAAAWAFGGSAMLTAIVGMVLTAVATVPTSLLILFLVGVFLLALAVMGEVGQRLQVGRGTATLGMVQAVETPREVAELHVTPLGRDLDAVLRVENVGSKTVVAARMMRIGMDSADYRIRWEPTNAELLTFPKERERAVVSLGVGEFRTLDVAHLIPATAKRRPEVRFPWPGRVTTRYDPKWLFLEFELDFETDPVQADGRSTHRYALEFTEDHSKIESFYETDATVEWPEDSDWSTEKEDMAEAEGTLP